MYASTKQARAIFKQVLGPGYSRRGSWTDVTSDSDPTRRSVSVCISDPDVLPRVSRAFAAAGFNQSVPKITSVERDYSGYIRGGCYIRVIAYI
jgi:hypothetical protein